MSARAKASVFEPPGGILIWIIVVVELLTFGAGLVVFAVQKRSEPAVFALGHARLSQPVALANTVILLTGGWFMANALIRFRGEQHRAASAWTGAAMLSGFAFLALKGWEYADKLDHGLTLRHDSFFTLYWLLTVFHCMHVAVAVVILTVFRISLRRGNCTAAHSESFEAGGIFWHLCDLVWLLLYPVLYLLP